MGILRALLPICLGVATGLSAHVGIASAQAPDPDLNEPFFERELQWGTSASRDACDRLRHAVWVEHALGTECIRYYPSPALDASLEGAVPRPKVAVVFFHGDHLSGTTPLGNYGRITPRSLLDIVRRHEQQRYGLEQVVLAGQSGGSTAAALLTLGRTDVKCAAMGSGNYAIKALAAIKLPQNPRRGCDVTGYCDPYDVIEHVDGIAKDPRRAIYVIGDPQDQNTVFELQRAFHDKLKQASHDVTLMEVAGRGPERHGTSHVTYRVAGLRARDLPVTGISNQGARQ
jgi:hypothetical protein